MADAFHALGDKTRRLVLDELAARDGRTLFDLCTTLVTIHGVTLTRQTISPHLGVLEAGSLVFTEHRGRCKLH